MLSGVRTIRIHGQDVPITAEIRNINALSAHADADETLAWLKSGSVAPKRTFITHGELRAATALQNRITKELGWSSVVLEMGQEASLI